uniref:Uncharacterized protein n=1 Tax=Paramormyrops kingsleyae TaxID=1676925 RepID=A0A3B3RZ06_9TELE
RRPAPYRSPASVPSSSGLRSPSGSERSPAAAPRSRLQMKGFSPVWTLLCLMRLLESANLFPHCLQPKGFAPVCTFWCFLRYPDWANLFPHCGQYFGQVKHLPQYPQMKRFSLVPWLWKMDRLTQSVLTQLLVPLMSNYQL